MHVDQVAEFVAVLVQMEHHNVLGRGICDFANVLVSGDFDDLAVLDFFGMGLELGHAQGVKLFGEFVIFVKVVFHLFELSLVFLSDEVLDFVRVCMLLLHDFLLLVKGGFLFEGNVITMFDLDVKPLGSDFVGHDR